VHDTGAGVRRIRCPARQRAFSDRERAGQSAEVDALHRGARCSRRDAHSCASEVAVQEAEAARIAVTAARIVAVLDRLFAFGRVAAEGIANTAYRSLQIRMALRPLLDSRLLVARMESAEALPVGRAVAKAAETRLVKAAEAGKGPELRIDARQFGRKIGKHAPDFGLDP
jgi:soluble lytic murein transglycosylase-like protein